MPATPLQTPCLTSTIRSLKTPGHRGSQGGGVPFQITHLALEAMAQVLVQPEAMNIGQTSSLLVSTCKLAGAWPTSPLNRSKCSQKLRASNRVSSFPHQKCAISTGWHTSWCTSHVEWAPGMNTPRTCPRSQPGGLNGGRVLRLRLVAIPSN